LPVVQSAIEAGAALMARMYVFKASDVADALRETTGLDPILWHCRCGCETCIAYARDGRALWFVSGMSLDPKLHVLGFETMFELNKFLELLSKRLNNQTMSMLRPTLEAAFRRRKETQ
jgi:hypothetical protein